MIIFFSCESITFLNVLHLPCVCACVLARFLSRAAVVISHWKLKLLFEEDKSYSGSAAAPDRRAPLHQDCLENLTTDESSGKAIRYLIYSEANATGCPIEILSRPVRASQGYDTIIFRVL